MVAAYERALADNGFASYWGHDARAQSPDTPDVFLHEIAVAQFRNRMRREKPVVGRGTMAGISPTMVRSRCSGRSPHECELRFD